MGCCAGKGRAAAERPPAERGPEDWAGVVSSLQAQVATLQKALEEKAAAPADGTGSSAAAASTAAATLPPTPPIQGAEQSPAAAQSGQRMRPTSSPAAPAPPRRDGPASARRRLWAEEEYGELSPGTPESSAGGARCLDGSCVPHRDPGGTGTLRPRDAAAAAAAEAAAAEAAAAAERHARQAAADAERMAAMQRELEEARRSASGLSMRLIAEERRQRAEAAARRIQRAVRRRQRAQREREDRDFCFEERRYQCDAERLCGQLPTRTLLVLGETGSGKSTLINAMANYAAGVDYSTPVRYRIVQGEQQRSQSESQTQRVTKYLIHCAGHEFLLRIIDTPGFGDTLGMSRDEQISAEIYEFLLREEEIHGVCFVAAASLPRLTVTQHYIINKVLTMFGNDARENIFLLITFADGRRAQVLSAIEASGFPFCPSRTFHFNNSALYASGSERNEYSAQFWKLGVSSLASLFSVVRATVPFSLSTTKDVIQMRRKLENYVASITPQVTVGLSKIDNLKRVLEDIKVNREKIDENRDYYYKETIPKVERKLKPPGTYNTQCLKCSYNCHHDCTRSNDEDKRNCCVMDDAGMCTVCPGKCHWSQHVNLDYYFDWSTQQVARVYDTKKLQLTMAKQGLSRSEALMSNVLEELHSVYETVHGLMTSIHETHRRLSEIALRPSNLRFTDYLTLLIESEKLHKRPGFEGRIEQLHIMLGRAKLEHDIQEGKYDPVGQWKETVERQLSQISGWQEPREPEPPVTDHGSDSDSSSAALSPSDLPRSMRQDGQLGEPAPEGVHAMGWPDDTEPTESEGTFLEVGGAAEPPAPLQRQPPAAPQAPPLPRHRPPPALRGPPPAPAVLSPTPPAQETPAAPPLPLLQQGGHGRWDPML